MGERLHCHRPEPLARRRGIPAAVLLAVTARGSERLDAEAIADAGLRLGRAALGPPIPVLWMVSGSPSAAVPV